MVNKECYDYYVIQRSHSLEYFAKIVVAEEICGGNEIILSKIGRGNDLIKCVKIVVAEEIG